MVKLKQCPFCGGEAEITRETYLPTRTIKTTVDGIFTGVCPRVNDGWLMECRICGARGPHKYTQPIQSSEQGIAAWNKRTTEEKEK